jgi:hypothetical protein
MYFYPLVGSDVCRWIASLYYQILSLLWNLTTAPPVYEIPAFYKHEVSSASSFFKLMNSIQNFA